MKLLSWTYRFMTDEALLQAYASGSADAFEVLYCRYKREVFLFLLRQYNNRQVCEDIVGEVWLGVIKGADGFVASSSFKAWLYRMAQNKLVDHWRRMPHESKIVGLLPEELAAIALTRNDSEDSLLINELLIQLERLSSEQLSSVLLKVNGFSYKEIAVITGSKLETVKSRLRYARRLINTKGAV